MENKQQKFKKDDSVVLSGSYTGLGDVFVTITGSNYSEMHSEFFYDSISNEGQKFYAAERFHIALNEYKQSKQRNI